MSMNDREKGFENKYAHDQNKLFRIEARGCKLLGLWAAEKLSLSAADADAYAKEVVSANLDAPGFDDVKGKLVKDFAEKGVSVSEQEIDEALLVNLEKAADQIENDTPQA